MRSIIFIILISLGFTSATFSQQKQEPWNQSELLDPAILADKINQNKIDNTVIINIGPDDIIKGSIDIGPTNTPESIETLRKYLQTVSKDKEVVLYCGCCPFDRCPNVRPAFELLKQLGFKDPKLLNLETNIKKDWLDKDYPTND